MLATTGIFCVTFSESVVVPELNEASDVRSWLSVELLLSDGVCRSSMATSSISLRRCNLNHSVSTLNPLP